jgi:hypothetical protein
METRINDIVENRSIVLDLALLCETRARAQVAAYKETRALGLPKGTVL